MAQLSPDQLTLEQQKNLETLKIHLGSLRELLGAKAGIVSVVASLSASVLVIATFNSNLLPVTVGLRIALTILLWLIPTSLLFHLLELLCAIRKTNNCIEKIVGEIKIHRHWYETLYDNLIGHFSLIGTLVLSGVVVYIVSILWR